MAVFDYWWVLKSKYPSFAPVMKMLLGETQNNYPTVYSDGLHLLKGGNYQDFKLLTGFVNCFLSFKPILWQIPCRHFLSFVPPCTSSYWRTYRRLACAAAGWSHVLCSGHPKHFAEAPASPCLPFPQPLKRPPASLTGKGFIICDKEATLWEESAWDVYYIRSAWTNGETPTEHVTATGQQGSGLKTAPLPQPRPPSRNLAPPTPNTLCLRLRPSPSQASSSAPCHVQTQTAKVTVHHKAHYCLFSVSAMYWAASCLKQMGNCIFHSAAPTPRLCQAQFVCRHMWKIWNSGQHIEPVGSQAHRQVWRRLRKCRRTSSLSPLQKNKAKTDKAEPPSGLAQSQCVWGWLHPSCKQFKHVSHQLTSDVLIGHPSGEPPRVSCELQLHLFVSYILD